MLYFSAEISGSANAEISGTTQNSNITSSGTSVFYGLNFITHNNVDLKVSGSGNVEINVEGNSISAEFSGNSGKATISGKVHDLNIRTRGNFVFTGMNLIASNATIRSSGSSNISIHVQEILNANTLGSSNIIYRGNPRIDLNSSRSSSVRAE